MGTKRRIFIGAFLLLVLLFLIGVSVAVRSHRGFTLGIWHQWRHATVAESANLLREILYWLEFMEKLTLDEKTGTYDFPPAKQGNLDPFEAGCLAYHRGDFTAAVRHLERAIEIRGETEERLFWLGMAYLRQAEAQNCLARLLDTDAQGQHQRMCTLPVGVYHDLEAITRRAGQTFTTLLEEHDPENLLYRWLLNFTYMTLDGYPLEVPDRFLIRTPFTEFFYGNGRMKNDASFTMPSFSDQARELGVDSYDTGRGVAVEDFDGDGDLDLVTAGGFEGLRYYENTSNGTFIDRTPEVGLDGVTQPFIITAADYDNDGRVDLFVSRPFDHFQLLRNGGGRFVDVTGSAGLGQAGARGEIAGTWVSAWGDVDNDGDLDLFLAQWAFRLPFVDGVMARPRMDSKLFINHGGRFTDKTAEYGLSRALKDQYFVGAAFGDFDDDRYPDLFVSSPLRATSRLYRNEEGRRFEDVDLVGRIEGGFVAAFVDVNHDGRLDIFQSGFADARTSTRQAVFGENLDRFHSGNSTILLQERSGTFVEHNEFFDGQMPMGTMGASYGDIDNDGCFDFYLGTGSPESWFILPNLMYLGERRGTRCTGRLHNISNLEGFGTIQKGHGIVFFDFDGDGDQDIYSSLGGMWPGDRWPNQLFANSSEPARSWVKIRLRGRQTNHFGVGARIRVEAVDAENRSIVRHYHMDNKTGFGSAPYLAHIGLLDAVEILRTEVRWPVSGCRRTYPAALRTVNVLDEGLCEPGSSATEIEATR